jgi:hypothetical protein
LSVKRTEKEKKRIWIWRERKTGGNPIEQKSRDALQGLEKRLDGIVAVERIIRRELWGKQE